MKIPFSLKKTLLLTLVCVLTFISFRYTLHNQFTNWDDDYYVTNDPYIKEFTPHNLKVIFTEDITKNNYHPLCMLSLAINYHFSQLNPQAYYLTNILIHIANVILVFFLFLALCKRLKVDDTARLYTASFGALWFGIHPMHVESVAWIAERKDVLYAFFYLQGLLCYLQYVDTGKKKWYWLMFLVFIASCLSKPMAVVFPLSLLCIDFLLARPWSKKLITEKIIFFLSSLICGAMAFYTQNKTGAIASFSTLTIAERFMYASYGFVMYIVKLFDPTNLSTFYPYPYRYISGYLQAIYYLAPFIAVDIVAFPLYILYKRKSPYFRIYGFGICFFVVNIMFVLQFISVGAAIMADRYSYVAYVGLFFMIAYFLYELMWRVPALKSAIVIILLAVSGLLAVLCHERTYAWHDSETLLTDAIEKYPYRALLSYKWLGNYYFSIGQLDKALENYNLLVSLHAADDKVVQNIARINALKGAPAGLLTSLGNAPKADPNDNSYKTYLDSAIAFSKTGDTLAAFRRYIAAFRMNPLAEKALAESSYNLLQSQQNSDAVRQYDMLLKLNTANPFYYFLRGAALYGENKIKPAIADWEVALKMNVKDVQQSAAYNLSVAYDTLGNDSIAIYYLGKAQSLGYMPKPEYAAKLTRKYQAQQAAHKK